MCFTPACPGQYIHTCALRWLWKSVTSTWVINNLCTTHALCKTILSFMKQAHEARSFVSFRNSLGWLCVSVVKAVALMTLSYFVDESQLDLLRLDAHMLQFFLDHIQAALRSRKFGHAGWMISEVIRGLSNLAKNDFNKHLIVSQGNHAAERSVNRCRSRVSFHFD